MGFAPRTAAWMAVVGLASGCDCGGTGSAQPCGPDAPCPSGWICVDGACRASDAGTDGENDGSDGGTDDGTDGGTDDGRVPEDGAGDESGPDAGCADGGVPCGAGCCAAGLECRYDVCVAPGSCVGDEDCGTDSYCDGGACVPYGTGPRTDRNPDCSRIVAVARFSPQLQCAWEGPPEGDAYPANRHVLSTPMVVDFDFDGDPDLVRPSIVFTTDDGVDGSSEQPTGVIRIISGRDCSQQFSLDAQLVCHSCPPAVGDIDGDGTPEIVAFKAGGGLVSFDYDRVVGTWGVAWSSHYADGTPYSATGGGWTGPSLHDLDDDGVPEVLRGGVIFDASGGYVGGALGYVPDAGSHAGIGIFPVVADVDSDGVPELVTGAGVYGWDGVARDWVREAYSAAGLPGGHAALADFGDFPMTALDPTNAPEVAVVTAGAVRVHTLESAVVFGPVTLPGGGTGGPPTVADFDGDGRAEIGVAGAGAYSVLDLDCTPAGGTGTCGSARTDGVLWSSTTQDYSSNVTGSSVFDFEGDGAAEVVYADECFVRVYSGATGDVIFSQRSSSCTWYENPVVADVDGDFNSEIVVSANTNCGDAVAGIACSGLEPGNVDPRFVGIHCELNEDCASGLCDAGFCRCTVTDDCCIGGCGDTGFVCAAPPAGTPGTGDTCRASRPQGFAGVRVYRDAADRWVGSRPIWNQHAYHVTHVEDGGRIPRTSAVLQNWRVAGLNNFRQNVQGGGEPLDSPDLTSRGGEHAEECAPGDPRIDLSALVCNRGTEPVDAGIPVAFYAGDPADSAPVACSAATDRVLGPGECAPVTCTWAPAPYDPVDVHVVVDPDSEVTECVEGNNWTVIPGVYCAGIG